MRSEKLDFSEGALAQQGDGSEVDRIKNMLPASGFRLRYAGLGFLWAWIYCTWFSPGVFGNAAGLTVNNDGTWIVSALFVTISLFASPFVFKRDLISIPWIIPTASIVNALGAIAMAHQAIFDIYVPGLSLLGAVVTGIASGWLWIMWGEFFGSVDIEVTYFTLPLTVAVPLCCFALTMLLQGPLTGLFVCLLPLLSGLCLHLSVNDSRVLSPVQSVAPLALGTCLVIFRQGVATFCIYVCISFCWCFVDFEAMGGWGGTVVLAYVIGGAAAILIAYLSTIFLPKRDAFGMYRWLVPMAFFAFAALVLDTPLACAVAFCLITTVQFGFDIVVWIYFAGGIREGRFSGRFAAGANRGFVQIGVFVGSVLGMSASSFLQNTNINSAFFILILLGLMTASVLMFFTSGEGSSSDSSSHANADAVSSATSEEDHLARNCEALAQNCSLTKRERDVLDLLATGRSVPYISEALCVSKNTVESHVKAIYRKVGVHSRQELITCLRGDFCDNGVLPD